MSSWSEVRLGGYELEGAARNVPSRHTGLFNSSDVVTQGVPDDEGYVRAYRMPVRELRRRLDLIGATVDGSIASFRAVVTEAARDAKDDGDFRYATFFRYAASLETADLIGLVEASFRHRNTALSYGGIELDFDLNIIQLLQGYNCTYFPDDSAPLWRGYAFEALACTFLDEEELFELDITALVEAGYFNSSDDPVGNAFDEQLAMTAPDMLVLGNRVDWEESEQCEFKSVQSASPVRAIRDSIAKYTVSFLNQTGGRLFFGISDEGLVEGVRLDRMQRDELSRGINQTLETISPRVSRNGIRVSFRSVVGSAHVLDDLFVVELDVPQGPAHEMYFKGDETWVRFGTESRPLKGHTLFVHILSAYRNALQPRERALPLEG